MGLRDDPVHGCNYASLLQADIFDALCLREASGVGSVV